MFFKITPINFGKETTYTLQQLPFDRYELPEKIYGTMEVNAKYVWNTFARQGGRASVLCTGLPGFGKSQMCKILCNLATDNNVPVYILSEIDITNKLIAFISTLNNCVIFIDEYGKQINYNMQNQFLTLLSDNNKKRLFLLTENDTRSINNFILNRPERIRYHFTFETLEPAIIKEYCDDHDVPKDFVEKLLTLNATNKFFSFDHLQTLVSEGKQSGCWDIDWLTSILNIKTLQARELYYPVKVSDTDNKVSIKLDHTILNKGVQKVSINTNYIELDKEQEELVEKIKIDYIDVDLGQGRPRDIDSNFTDLKLGNGTVILKLNINPDFLLKASESEEVYPDVTGKYLITVRHGKLTL